MDYITLVLRWLHLLSSVIMVGGLFHMRFAVLPALEAIPKEHHEAFNAALRRSWFMLMLASLTLLVVSGITNMVLVPMFNDFPSPEARTNYSMLVGIKLVLALPVFFIVSMIYGRSANAEKFRRKTHFWLNVAILLSIVIIFIGGYVRFIPRTPKKAEAPGQALVVPASEATIARVSAL